jgi:CRISPR system Cascade subunit CasA
LENRFNLIDEAWIPVANYGRVSLKEIFSNLNLPSLGGNALQKIALYKLLLTIAQSANTPIDNDNWLALGSKGLAKQCLDYLEKWYDKFYLYGEQPFLQLPAIAKANLQSFGAVLPEIATGNTSVLTQLQRERVLDDAERALLIIQLMGLALGGKKTDNSIVLTSGYMAKTKDNGKAVTGKPGPSLGHMGFLHNFVLGNNVLETIWLNLWTQEDITHSAMFINGGLGTAPWEQMPQGEDDLIAQQLRKSFLGRLVPLNRFVLLTDRGIHYSEGIIYPSYKDGVWDPSISVNMSSKDPKAIWTDVEKKPWRSLGALLSFIINDSEFRCLQLEFPIKRLQKLGVDITIGVWSGGLRVSSNAGEQYVSGSDDYVESKVALPEIAELNEDWFDRLKTQMADLDTIAKILYGCVLAYYRQLGSEGKEQAQRSTGLFWQLCEVEFQNLVNSDNAQLKPLRQKFARLLKYSYDYYCSNQTARQLDAWVKSQPNLSNYLGLEKKLNLKLKSKQVDSQASLF